MYVELEDLWNKVYELKKIIKSDKFKEKYKKQYKLFYFILNIFLYFYNSTFDNLTLMGCGKYLGFTFSVKVLPTCFCCLQGCYRERLRNKVNAHC